MAYAATSPGAGGAVLACFDKLVSTLLIFVNLIIAGYAGAALATAARLRYDPSTYVVVREMVPADYELASAALPAAALAVLGSAMFAVAALAMPRCLRFFMLVLYALVMLGLAAAELWLGRKVWLELDAHVQEAHERLENFLWHMHMVLDLVVQWYSAIWKVKTILREIQKDAPMNLVVAKRAALGFVALQVAAGVLAILAAVTGLRLARARRA